MSSPISSLGILGAGRIGRAIAALARDAGLAVEMVGSTGPFETVVRADAVVLAVPLSRLDTLPDVSGALVIDAMNYWWELDGAMARFEDPSTSSSEIVARSLRGARVVKTLNHLSGYALEELARAHSDPERLGMAVAGDDEADRDRICALVDALGFTPVVAGALADGVRFEPLTEAFGADADAEELADMLARFWDSQRGRVVARARGHAR
ncbi:NADPH-dependent F420 reductase [Demequina globuliformis]|uniref:NADPH-dependent F420 reductase n=1 Tax=Demequina globuliformis TaxID=676202 RepID=UPI000B0C0AA2|nr:NADP oxidoreductase [Demequina globuliformis]